MYSAVTIERDEEREREYPCVLLLPVDDESPLLLLHADLLLLSTAEQRCCCVQQYLLTQRERENRLKIYNEVRVYECYCTRN